MSLPLVAVALEQPDAVRVVAADLGDAPVAPHPVVVGGARRVAPDHCGRQNDGVRVNTASKSGTCEFVSETGVELS